MNECLLFKRCKISSIFSLILGMSELFIFIRALLFARKCNSVYSFIADNLDYDKNSFIDFLLGFTGVVFYLFVFVLVIISVIYLISAILLLIVSNIGFKIVKNKDIDKLKSNAIFKVILGVLSACFHLIFNIGDIISIVIIIMSVIVIITSLLHIKRIK